MNLEQLGEKVGKALAKLVLANPGLTADEINVCNRIYRAHLLGVPMTKNAQDLFDKKLKEYL